MVRNKIFQSFCIILSVLFIFSCSKVSKNKKVELSALKSTLDISGRSTDFQLAKNYNELQTRLSDARYYSKVREFVPAFTFIKAASISLITYIDSLTKVSNGRLLLNEQYTSKIFYDKLKQHTSSVLATYSSFKTIFQHNEIIPLVLDSIASAKELFSIFFKDKSAEEIELNLTMLKNNIRNLENEITTYIVHEADMIINTYEMFSAIIGQSAKIVNRVIV